ncbi:uncharacterized protein LOC133533801 [Cydia pomonella]|uniref:uncharacterized protein LOC133518345 n=1 Tax=Cydia pomonella TaxID=82600 RepID=UPI002ADE5F76|nr:uncharacterized protein LOC133518345 [Cydia pomonella]XP_061728836.1 uncharacterized protein LOC133533801 [Cydia pomonella]
MSPLACSLLALAALIAAADALKPNPYCSYLEMGQTEGYPTDNYVEFTLNVAGGTITIPDKCTRLGNMIIGEAISVCNTPNSKPEITPALQTEYQFKPNLGSVHIECPSDIDGCDRLDVEITQYCSMVTANHIFS